MARPPPDAASGILSDNGILRGLESQAVVIHPFRRANLGSASYDVTLGPYFFRENAKKGFINPYRANVSSHAWTGPWTASHVSKTSWAPDESDRVSGTDLVIVLAPGESIIAHTCEFIGSANPIVPALVPCSGLERCFIHVEGGIGDAGYMNRWTLRITNTSKEFTIPLIAGRKIAKVVFYQTEGVIRAPYNGNYQTGVSLADLVRNWKPEHMLPRLHQDPVPEGKLSMRSDPVPLPAWRSLPPPQPAPHSGYSVPQPQPHAAPPPNSGYGVPHQQPHAAPPQPSMSMVNPDAARAAALHQQQYSQQGPIHLRPMTRDANGEVIAPTQMPSELIPVKTRELRAPPVVRSEYDPYTI